MARITGANFDLKFIHAGGTANLKGDYRSFDDGLEQESADVSAGGDKLRTYAKTLSKLAPSATLLYDDAAAAAVTGALVPGVAGTLMWGVAGTVAGKPKAAIACFVAKVSTKSTFDKETEITIEWANTGSDWVHNPATATY